MVLQLLYLSEKSDQLLAGVSRRVELATKFSLTRSRLDAENYQVSPPAFLQPSSCPPPALLLADSLSRS